MKKVYSLVLVLVIMLLVTGCGESLTDAINDLEDITGSSSSDNFTYEVSSEYDSYTAHYIEGVVSNNSDSEYSYVQIEFVCYDSDGNNLGTAIDNTNNLLGNETWKFKAMGLFSDENVDHCNFKEITGW